MNNYGKCRCDGLLEPVWYIEEELDRDHAPTGRKRNAVSHLVCPECGKNHCVDDSFDRPWQV